MASVISSDDAAARSLTFEQALDVIRSVAGPGGDLREAWRRACARAAMLAEAGRVLRLDPGAAAAAPDAPLLPVPDRRRAARGRYKTRAAAAAGAE